MKEKHLTGIVTRREGHDQSNPRDRAAKYTLTVYDGDKPIVELELRTQLRIPEVSRGRTEYEDAPRIGANFDVIIREAE